MNKKDALKKNLDALRKQVDSDIRIVEAIMDLIVTKDELDRIVCKDAVN